MCVCRDAGQVRRVRSNWRSTRYLGTSELPVLVRAGIHSTYALCPLLLPLSEELERAGLGPAPLLLLCASFLTPLVLFSREQLGSYIWLLLRERVQRRRLVVFVILQ